MFVNKNGQPLEKKATPRRIFAEKGSTSSKLYSGFFDFDPNTNWSDRTTKIAEIEKMRTNVTIKQVLKIYTDILFSANYYLVPYDDSDMAKKIMDFQREVMFELIDWDQYKRDSTQRFPYGWALFAKNWKKLNDKVVLREMKYLEPSSLLKWTIDGMPQWIDGHPPGITQYRQGTQEETNIPDEQLKTTWNYLTLFTYDQEGKRYEGNSLLRSVYMNWYLTDLYQKIQSVALNRFGAGVVTVSYPKGTTDDVQKRYEDMARYITSNEQSFATYEEGVKLEIKYPEGQGLASSMDDAIRFQDGKIYDAINASFMGNRTGEGSRARDTVLSEFFFKAIKNQAQYFVNKNNELLKEIAFLNGYPVEMSAKMAYADLEAKNFEAFVKPMAEAKNATLVTWTSKDEQAMREFLDLPKLEDVEDEIEEAKQKQEEEEKKAKVEEKKEKPEGELEEKKQEDELEENSTKKKILNSTTYTRTSKREATFSRQISDYENFLESYYSNQSLPVMEKAEKKMKKVVNLIYDKADKTMVDGVKVFAITPKNTQLRIKGVRAINELKKKMNTELRGYKMTKLFEKTEKMAAKNYNNIEKLAITFPKSKYNAFIKGYVSNIDAIIDEDPRRLIENFEDNMKLQHPYKLSIDQYTDKNIFNRNRYKLSITAHPRGLYNSYQFNLSKNEGYIYYKILTPKKDIKNLSPEGMTASVLFMIVTYPKLVEMINKKTDGKNTDPVNGLGLHHNSKTYYLPISSEELEDEQEISREQRKRLKSQLNN